MARFLGIELPWTRQKIDALFVREESEFQLRKLLENGLSKGGDREKGYDPMSFGQDAASSLMGEHRFSIRGALQAMGICYFVLKKDGQIRSIAFDIPRVKEVVAERLIHEGGDEAALRLGSIKITDNDVARVLTLIFKETASRVEQETEAAREEFMRRYANGEIEPRGVNMNHPET